MSNEVIKAWRTIYAILQQTGYVEMHQDEITTIVNFIKENAKEAIKSERRNKEL